MNQLPDMPGRSDMGSKDLAELKILLEEKTSEYAELLKQHEFSLTRVTSDLSERSKQLQAAQTDAHHAFQQSKAQHADLLDQLHRAHLATQQAHDAQVEAEQQLQTTQHASAQQLHQVTADFDQQVHAAKHSAREESGEKLQIVQQEYEDQLAAAMSEADQKMSIITTQLSQQLQAAQSEAQQQQLQVHDMQHQADAQLQIVTHELQQQLEAEHQDRLKHLQQQSEAEHQNRLNGLQQQLQAAHHDSLKQLQQQLQACEQDCESLQAEKLALEQQVLSAKADSDRDLQELRDKIRSAAAAQMRQHSCKLEDEHKKAAGRHQVEVAELQAALERQQQDSVWHEHQVLQEHMAGLAAKDTMVQQMWSELHESKQGSRRFEVEAAELAAELRCTKGQLGKSERDMKGWIIVYKRLVDDKMSLVNERHHLMNRIARLEEGAATYLTGQHHDWQVVPPPCHPSTQSSPAQDVNAEAWPDTPRPSLPDQAPTLSDDNPLAPAHLDYAPSPEPEQAMSSPSLAAQHSAHAHTSETAVQGQHADSDNLDCHLEEEHADQTDGSDGPDLDSAHFSTTTVAAEQADREEEVSGVEEEEHEEQDSAHLTITHAAADQAEEEEYEQQSEPAQDPASSDADYDHNGDGSSGNEAHHQGGKAVMTSSAGSSGTAAVPSSSSFTSSDGPAVPTPAVDAAGDQATGGLSAAIRPSPENAGSTNVSTDGPPAVPSFEAERVGDAMVSLAAAAQHQESSITAASGDTPIPAQTEEIPTPPAEAAEISTPPSNNTDEEDEELPIYDSLSEGEEETEEVSSSKGEDAAEEEAAEASDCEEDEMEVSESEDEEVASDQDGEAVAGLHRKIRELEAQESGWRAGYARLHKTYTNQSQHLAQLQADFARVWADLLALHMVASDAVTCSQRPNGAQPRFARSPHTSNSVDMTHIKVIQHRLFNLMDADGDGVLSEEDVNMWADSHLKAGTMDRDEVMRRKFEGSDQTDLETQPDWQLCGWVVEQLWQMLREMFAPQSQDPRWKGVSAAQFLKAQLGHDVGALLCSPLEFLDDCGGSRTSCKGSSSIQWGPLVQDNCSELDFTAVVFECYA
ncbi:TPA: hypothetical protein ACH3X1_000745 [Trebouxia sp. C0004]